MSDVFYRPFPVDMLDVVRADFAGDNVGCWMQIQVGKGPWASEVSGLVKIGQTMTMVLAIKDDEQKFDMLVRNCMAHDGKRPPIQLVDQQGCITRPKLMSKFNKIKNFGASASVLSYAHFQAFKFPDSMEVHFQCTIQICRYACPEQCPAAGAPSGGYAPAGVPSAPAPVKNDDYGAPAAAPQSSYNGPNKARTKRFASNPFVKRDVSEEESDSMGDVGIEKVIHVVSSGDLTFDIKEGGNDTVVDIYPPVAQSLHEEQVMLISPSLSRSRNKSVFPFPGLYLYVNTSIRRDPHHFARHPHRFLLPLSFPLSPTPELLRRHFSNCSIYQPSLCPQERTFLSPAMCNDHNQLNFNSDVPQNRNLLNADP